MAMWKPPRYRLLCSLIAVCLMASATPEIMVAQGESAPIEVYHSQEFGYLFWWDAADWTVINQETGQGFDSVQLADDDTLISMQGFAATGLVVEECLANRLWQLAADPDIDRLEAIDAPDIPPAINASPSGELATVSFVVSTGSETYIADERCTTLVPGEVFLVSSVWTTFQAYQASRDQVNCHECHASLDATRVTMTLTLPSAYWDYDSATQEFLGPDSATVRRPVARLIGPDGSKAGIIAGNDFYCAGSVPASPTAPTPTLVIENTGTSALTLAADDFVATDDVGIVPTSPLARWLSPPSAATTNATIQPGAFAIAQFDLLDGAWISNVYVIDPAGQPIFLFEHRDGCQGGGALPVRIATD